MEGNNKNGVTYQKDLVNLKVDTGDETINSSEIVLATKNVGENVFSDRIKAVSFEKTPRLITRPDEQEGTRVKELTALRVSIYVKTGFLKARNLDNITAKLKENGFETSINAEYSDSKIASASGKMHKLNGADKLQKITILDTTNMDYDGDIKELKKTIEKLDSSGIMSRKDSLEILSELGLPMEKLDARLEQLKQEDKHLAGETPSSVDSNPLRRVNGQIGRGREY